MERCGTCQFFQRGRWHKVIDPDESEQKGGYCEILFKALLMTNSHKMNILSDGKLYVQDTFGCSLHRNQGGE